MTEGLHTAVLLPSTQVEELLRTLVKGLRAFQMYLPNNPVYQRAIQNVRAAFEPIWAATDQLVITVAETDFIWDEQVVYHQLNKSESLAWSLYKDGMRVFTLHKGVEHDEIIRFLEIIQRARTLSADAGDDLLTLLWEQEFTLIQYHFAEFFADGQAPLLPGGVHPPAGGGDAGPPPATPEQMRGQVEEEAPVRKSGVVDLDEFDSTLYWLDESEIAAIAKAIEAEYQQDLRANALAILFDLFELQAEAPVRVELLTILESFLPHLLNAGDFRSVASMLRESRVILHRAPVLLPEERERLDSFTGRLSEPGVLGQLLQSVDEATARPSEEDLGELFSELRPSALETVLVWLPKISSVKVRELLEASAERLAEGAPAEVMRLLRSPLSEALVSVIGLCRRLKLPASVPGLGDTLGHTLPAVRLASVQALAAIASPGALGQIERGVDDADRDVRINAVKEMGRRGYKGALRRIEPLVQGKVQRDVDLTERMAFFEAYALIAGQGALDTLAALLGTGGLFRRKENAETRACAALAIGKIRTPAARDVLQKASSDKELVVRNAVSRALRENAS
ncbi:MAG: hypothetical protein ABJD11_04245 [Gemmatimonadota bacterium]